jgi:hypothetical protein
MIGTLFKGCEKMSDKEILLELIKSVVNMELNNRNLIGGDYHVGTVESVISRYAVKVYLNGITDTSYSVPCNPNIIFVAGDEVWVHYVNGDPNNKFIPYKRATGTEAYDSGGGDYETYTHNQISPSATWNIVHNLSRYPNVSIVDSGGNLLTGDVQYTSPDTIKLSFTAAFSGKAYVGQ